MSDFVNERAEQERRRWMREDAHLHVRPDADRFMRHDAHRFIRHDAHRFMPSWMAQDWVHPDGRLNDPHVRKIEERRAAARAAQAVPEQQVARMERSAIRGNPPIVPGFRFAPSGLRSLGGGSPAGAHGAAPSLDELRKLEANIAALKVDLARIRHVDAVRKARGLPPLPESGPDWQALLRKFAHHQEACRKAGTVTFDEKAGFNPTQPRIPAGNPDGGQWTDSGGASGTGSGLDGSTTGGGITDPRVISDATPDNDWKPGARYAENEVDHRTSVVLESEPRFRHIEDGHIDRSDGELLDELRKNYYRGYTMYGFQPAEGSFTDVRSANDLINQTLQANSTLVDRVATGEVPQAILEHRFGYPTGKEAFRPNVDTDPYIRQTYGVRVMIRHDAQRKNGYRLVTAYPINSRKRR